MIWAIPLALASVTATAPLASTYDQAACATDEAALAQPAEVADDGDERDCSAPVATPTIIDCNDPGMSRWVGEMIGSCDMPKPAPPGQGTPSVRANREAAGPSNRVCDGFRCTHEAPPLRPAARSLAHDSPVLLSRIQLECLSTESPLGETATVFIPRVDPDRLERPPRV